jgi:hypothetical protein
MKNLLLLPLLGMACAAALAQTAQDPQVLDSIRIPATQAAIEVPARTLRMHDIDFGAYQGAYELGNGGLLQLTAQGRRMYAQIDDGARSEIVGTGRQDFVALDRSMKMSFERLDNGDLGGELLIARTPAVAGEPVQYLLVALRR